MLCVHIAGDEFGTLTHDFRQNSFVISVNRYHLDQLNDASPRVLCMVRLSPGQLELIRPLADQLTLQRPPLLIRLIGYGDLQHYSPSTACQKPTTSEARTSHNPLTLSTIRSSITCYDPECAYLGKRNIGRWTGKIGSQPPAEFAAGTHARPYRYDCPTSQGRETDFDLPDAKGQGS
jgi:hypothetical protein